MGNLPTQEQPQYLFNYWTDMDVKPPTLVVGLLGYDGSSYSRVPISSQMNVKIQESGLNTYIGIAPIGTAQNEAKWQCRKISDDGAGNTVIIWASNGNYDQVATDLTVLSYA